MSLEKALDFTLTFEGGYVNDPVDPGGATKYGISLREARKLHPELDLDKDNDGDVDADDIKLFTKNDAIEIYTEKFWLPNHCDAIHSPLIASRIFDTAVNMGSRQAGRIAQRAFNVTVGFHDTLRVDGIIGYNTLEALNSCFDTEWMLAYKADRWAVYRWIMDKSPKMKKYYNGWGRRAMA